MATAIQAPANAAGPTQHTQNQTNSRLTAPQLRLLHQQVNPNRVRILRGLSHMEAWDVRRQLTRVFGFGGYSTETLALDLVAERETKQGERSRWTVVYRAQVRLIVFDVHGREISHWDDGAAGDAVNQPSLGDAHDMAMKTALSQATKRCATNLGDQFGLSLYSDGSTDAVVQFSAAHPPAEWQRQANPLPEPEDPPVRAEQTPVPVAEAVPAPVSSVPTARASAPTIDEKQNAALDALVKKTQEDWSNLAGLAQVLADATAQRLLTCRVQGPDGEWVEFQRLLNGRVAELKAARDQASAA